MNRILIARTLFLLALGFTFPHQAYSQQPPLPLVKGNVYSVKIPTLLLSPVDYRSGWNEVYRVLAADVGGTPTAVTVGGRPDWKTAGFPSMLEMKFEKITNTKTGSNELDFRSVSKTFLFDVRLRFRPGLDYRSVLGELVVVGPPTSEGAAAYLTETYAGLAERFFAGPLSSVPKDKQMLLVSYAHRTAMASRVDSETYKTNLYMVADLGQDSAVYNDLKFTDSTRLAEVMNAKLLTLLKGFAKPIEGLSQIYGVKLEYKIPHKSFLSGGPEAVDVLHFYAPSDLIKKFADADITNQEFVDGCVAILNDNRVKVQLTGSAQ